jgi:phage-related protein
MNIEQAVIENLRRLPADRQSDAQSAIQTIEQMSATMTQPGIVTDQDLADYVKA